MASRKETLAEGVELYLGDCAEIMPTLSRVDAVVTDPPYGIEDIVGAYGRGQLWGKTRLIAGDKSLEMCSRAFSLLAAHQKDVWILAFFSSRVSPLWFEATKTLDYFGEIVWDKKAPGLTGVGFVGIRYQHENVSFFKVGNPPDLIATNFSILPYYRAGEAHAHEKPVGLMESLCKMIGGSILDPFMGSGTTGVAAVNLGRKFIGIEIHEPYFDTACRRISKALSEQSLFTDKPSSNQAGGLF